jgi:hypothetical protein
MSNADFKAALPKGAPGTRSGHALKDLQLQDRILAQRCSYLIYSESFRALPEMLKARSFEWLRTALCSTDPRDRYAHLPAAERRRIHDILLERQPDAPRQWSTPRAAANRRG